MITIEDDFVDNGVDEYDMPLMVKKCEVQL